MEKFKIYSNDPYDFNDYKQIEEFYKLIGNDKVIKNLSEEDRGKIFLKILADKKEQLVEVSLIKDRSSESSKIKLPGLVLDYQEFKLNDAEKFLDMSEYMEFD
jgi:hypothetical protein